MPNDTSSVFNYKNQGLDKSTVSESSRTGGNSKRSVGTKVRSNEHSKLTDSNHSIVRKGDDQPDTRSTTSTETSAKDSKDESAKNEETQQEVKNQAAEKSRLRRRRHLGFR